MRALDITQTKHRVRGKTEKNKARFTTSRQARHPQRRNSSRHGRPRREGGASWSWTNQPRGTRRGQGKRTSSCPSPASCTTWPGRPSTSQPEQTNSTVNLMKKWNFTSTSTSSREQKRVHLHPEDAVLVDVPSGGLTLIVGTQKWGFSCKEHRRPPADIFLNESLPLKTPQPTPCSWPPWSWFSREKSLKIFKVS